MVSHWFVLFAIIAIPHKNFVIHDLTHHPTKIIVYTCTLPVRGNEGRRTIG